jgi:hypothetical protein
MLDRGKQTAKFFNVTKGQRNKPHPDVHPTAQHPQLQHLFSSSPCPVSAFLPV